MAALGTRPSTDADSSSEMSENGNQGLQSLLSSKCSDFLPVQVAESDSANPVPFALAIVHRPGSYAQVVSGTWQQFLPLGSSSALSFWIMSTDSTHSV